ncbi:MAG: AAC(3) family N-acetyltransferase [Bacteroidota bacterium]
MANNKPKMTCSDLVQDLSKLGVKSGDLLNVKASLSSIGDVEGGAQTLINALVECVGDKGTIITDSFVNCYPLPLNRINSRIVIDSKSASYAGALANAMIRDSRSFRSSHPIQKFASIGHFAKELMENHTPNSYAYDVLRILIQHGGKNLKIGSDEKVYGFGTTHVAIGTLGHRQKRPQIGVIYNDCSGNNKLFQLNWSGIGHGVNKFVPKYQAAGAVIGQGYVGYAPSKITSMKITYDVEVEELRLNPRMHLCDLSSCALCRLSWEYSDYSLYEYIMRNKVYLSVGMLMEAYAIEYKYRYTF